MSFSPNELPAAAQQALQKELEAKLATIAVPHLEAIAEGIRSLNFSDASMEITDGIVSFTGKYGDDAAAGLAEKLARDLIPWRKGPFQLRDLAIDAEWRSDKKWDRLSRDLPDLKGKIVADVGCNNGYYLFRIAEAGARQVLGFDPTLKYWLQFQLVNAHAPELPIGFLLLGWEALVHLPEYFDVIFLMGVNYHAAHPLEIFHTCKNALKPGGMLICESVVVPGDAQLEIFPAGKYAGIGGVYAMPTASALMQQLGMAGFADIRLQHSVKMTADEQRTSEFSPQKSFADAINGDGTSIEGQHEDQGNSVAIPQGAGSGASMRLRYPPVHRAAILASKS